MFPTGPTRITLLIWNGRQEGQGLPEVGEPMNTQYGRVFLWIVAIGELIDEMVSPASR